MNIKVNFTYLFSAILLTLMLSLNGCGSGGTTTTNNNGQTTDNSGNQGDPTNNGDTNTSQSNESKFKYQKISIAGSSITHGECEDDKGCLGEKSYVGEVEKYFREEVADTIGPDDLTNEDRSYAEPMSYMGKLKVYGEGTVISGTLEPSDEIAIVYAGTNITTVVELEVDGKVYEHTIEKGNYKPVKKLFDDTNTDFRKAFRQTDEKAVKIWKLPENKEHTFSLTVKQGELHLNFITNHMYFMQNAGVSGYEAADFLNEGAKSSIKEVIEFKPDLFILESSTNDAKTWQKEILLEINSSIDAPSTNEWRVGNSSAIGFFSNGKNIYPSQAVSVKKGDVVIIGEYDGDIQNMVVGIVEKDATNSRNISLSKIVSYKDQTAKEVDSIPSDIVKKCRIKSIKVWEDRVKEIIQRLKNRIGKNVVVAIGTSGVPNYYKPGTNQYTQNEYTPRRLLGYRERGKMIADENGWFFVDFFQRILEVEPGVDIEHKWTYGDNTHPNAQGRVYFGEAVKRVLKSL